MVSPTREPTPGKRADDAVAAGAFHLVPRRLGPYEIVRLLGRGGMGTVFEARHTKLLRRVAIKLVAPNRLQDASARLRFQREIVALGAVQHANIVQALDAGEEGDTAYLVMEFVAGSDVDTIARREGRLSAADACEIVRQSALGLDHAHEQRIVHRDVKPGNLLLGRDGVVKVADLGLARVIAGAAAEPHITDSHAIMGTLNYMSPEQAAGGRDIDARADVYGLGAVLYRLLAGEPLFSGPEYETPQQVLLALVTGPLPLPAVLRAELPYGVAAVVERALAKDREERYSSARELAEALAPLAAGAQLGRLVSSEAVGATLEFTPAGSTPLNASILDSRHVPAEGDVETRVGRRFRGWPLWTACAALAVAVGGWSLWNQFNRTETLPAVNGSQGTGGAKKSAKGPLSRLVWHDVFDSPLLVVRQPRDPGLTTWTLDPKLRLLKLSTRGTTVLAFETTPQPPYRFQCDVFQNQWTGGWGVIFGAKKSIADSETVWTYQEIGLQPASPSGAIDGSFLATRGKVTLRIDAAGTARADTTQLTSAHVSLLESRPQALEIDVGPAGLVSVRLGGVSLPRLCTAEVNAACKGEDYVGMPGVQSERGDATFTSGRVMMY